MKATFDMITGKWTDEIYQADSSAHWTTHEAEVGLQYITESLEQDSPLTPKPPLANGLPIGWQSLPWLK